MIKLIADSTCDLSQEMCEKYNITLVPLTIRINEKTYRDRVDIQPDEFYAMFENLDDYPTTSTPTPMAFFDEFKQAVEDGYDEIICICMSSGTSGTYQSAVIAKEYFFDYYEDANVKLHVVDSYSMSHGSGYLLMKSGNLIENGATYDEVIEFNETYKKCVKHYLSVDDLDHLVKSGRLTNASAFIGKMLKIKPIMSMKGTKGAIVAKERGTKKVLKHYTDQFISRVNPNLTDFIIIGYTSDMAIAKNLKNLLIDKTGFEGDIHIMQMGVSVGTHVGLGAVSMYFIEKCNKPDGLFINEATHLQEVGKEMTNKFKENLEKVKKM